MTRHLYDFKALKIGMLYLSTVREVQKLYNSSSVREVDIHNQAKWACSKEKLHMQNSFLFPTNHLEFGVQEPQTPVLKTHQLILALTLPPQVLLSMVQKNNSLELQKVVLSQSLSREN